MDKSYVGKQYTECRGFKIWDKVYRLNHYDVEQAFIKKIFDDYYSDDEEFLCKWVETNKGYDRLEDVFKEEYQAENKIQAKKTAYDNYVTSRY